MTDLVDKVARAMTRYNPAGGDDWGYVENTEGPYVDPEKQTDLGSWGDACNAAEYCNARAAIAAVLDDLIHPTPAMFRAFHATEGNPNYNVALAIKWQAMLTAKRKSLGL